MDVVFTFDHDEVQAKATADMHQFQGARPHAGNVPKVCTSRRIEKQVYNTGLSNGLWVSFIVQGDNNGDVPPARKLEWQRDHTPGMIKREDDIQS